ncbi:hypothetical protein [Leuconostoc inhae]|uniref:hypothetical protein n=1 Tax=Leuconostoc inhae TaxID=178001 RepID=UPI001C7D7211|nr:hypothetical protein [Leuconostoc inhae]
MSVDFFEDIDEDELSKDVADDFDELLLLASCFLLFADSEIANPNKLINTSNNKDDIDKEIMARDFILRWVSPWLFLFLTKVMIDLTIITTSIIIIIKQSGRTFISKFSYLYLLRVMILIISYFGLFESN